MPTLAIDTATDTCAIALGDGASLIACTRFAAGRAHLEMLLPRVQELLEEAGLTSRDIDGIVTGTGPGTFSGLRVGVSTTRGMAQALGVPLTGFSTLRALALGISDRLHQDEDQTQPQATRDIMPVIDARRGEVFAQLFRSTGTGQLDEISGIICLAPEALVKSLHRLTDRPVMAAGNGVLAYRAVFSSADRIESLDPDDPSHVIHAGYHLQAVSREAADSQNIFRLTPVYGREPDADKTVLSRKRKSWLQ
ncbi:MAG: tRNA (adenosine(37)-N6)-threonylcarbamoyltransferase complex dimerization subunit type 1 TsaB [Thermoleophilia bacterium]